MLSTSRNCRLGSSVGRLVTSGAQKVEYVRTENDGSALALTYENGVLVGEQR